MSSSSDINCPSCSQITDFILNLCSSRPESRDSKKGKTAKVWSFLMFFWIFWAYFIIFHALNTQDQLLKVTVSKNQQITKRLHGEFAEMMNLMKNYFKVESHLQLNQTDEILGLYKNFNAILKEDEDLDKLRNSKPELMKTLGNYQVGVLIFLVLSTISFLIYLIFYSKHLIYGNYITGIYFVVWIAYVIFFMKHDWLNVQHFKNL
uniref:Uncharacterized protein n=1 Tax=Panagrolaimus sp. JU765 TaxID=591449 RepID=A0AC34RQI9_9BILA